jgi:nanoRNase/pAp phosphatase (c-di-AMP/oligoRNAs hydrolase)
LPGDLQPLVVFDHHPSRPSTRDIPFCDIRPDYGATATIMWEYLHAAGLPCRRRYATGLFYAIRSETQNLGREGGSADVRAYVSLFPHVDNRIISRIEQAPISRKYLALLNGAFHATRLYGDLSITPLDRMPYPDVPAELADLLLRVDQVTWALVMGIYRGDVYVSIEPEGRAGGHGSMAGGKVNLRTAHLSADKAMRLLSRRAREVHGVGGVRGKRLLRGH